jgi:hypothetical protein
MRTVDMPFFLPERFRAVAPSAVDRKNLSTLSGHALRWVAHDNRKPSAVGGETLSLAGA